MNIAPRDFLIYALAHEAFKEAGALAEHLLGMEPPPDKTLFAACVAGIVTSYCRPFMDADGLGKLPPEMEKFETMELEAIHADVFEFRHKFSAHFDLKHSEKTARRGSFSRPLGEVQLTLRDDDFEVRTNAASLSPKTVQTIRTLCAYQMERVSNRLEKFAVEIRDKEKRIGEFVYRVESN